MQRGKNLSHCTTYPELGREGASVVISSRKQTHVDSALQHLKRQGLSVEGMVCHVGKKEDRKHLLQKVCIYLLIAAVFYQLCLKLI